MNCSIMNQRVQLHMQSGTALALTLEAANQAASKSSSIYRTALQNSELRRAELATMLRRALKKQQSEKSQKTYWAVFMNSYVRGNANSNEFFE